MGDQPAPLTFLMPAMALVSGATVSSAVCAVAMATLVVLAVVSLFTGFRVAFLSYRLCPVHLRRRSVAHCLGMWL